MKRSEAITKLLPKVVSHHEIISQANFDSGIYRARAERLLKFIEEELGMSPPDFDGTVYGYNEGLIMPPKWEEEDT